MITCLAASWSTHSVSQATIRECSQWFFLDREKEVSPWPWGLVRRESKENCLNSNNIEKHSWFATARKIAYYCTKLVEQPFSSFSTKEKQSAFLLLAEVAFAICSLITVKVDSKKSRHRPQGGIVRFQFGGKAPLDHDPFGGIKGKQTPSDRPTPTPGVKVFQRPQQPVKKDKDFPF